MKQQTAAQKSPEKSFAEDFIRPIESNREEIYFLAQIRAQGKLGGLKIA
jgi:hypothetical protein